MTCQFSCSPGKTDEQTVGLDANLGCNQDKDDVTLMIDDLFRMAKTG